MKSLEARPASSCWGWGAACEEGGAGPSPAPLDHGLPAPPPSSPFLQNKHPRAQTAHPAKAQMEPELELISPVARATRTGPRSSLFSRPAPTSQAPPLPLMAPPTKAMAPPSPPAAAGGFWKERRRMSGSWVPAPNSATWARPCTAGSHILFSTCRGRGPEGRFETGERKNGVAWT